jgi:hypothetical protein
MDERARRLWAGTEADAIGYSGVAAVARATKMAISTVPKARDEVFADQIIAVLDSNARRSRPQRSEPAQLVLFKKRGGKRRGAGRKPKGRRAGSPHKARPELKARHPVHVVLRSSARSVTCAAGSPIARSAKPR